MGFFLQQLVQEPWARIQKRWRRTPTVLQMEATECGAACLGILLQYHGCYLPLIELRELCGVSRDGSKAKTIVLAARSLGFQSSGYSMPLEELKQLTQPVILFWEFNHFVVLEGFVGDIAMVNDPAMGLRRIDQDDFNQAYTGVVLSIEPDEGFKPFGHKKSFWPLVWQRTWREPAGISFLALISLVLIIPSLVSPVFLQIYLDEVFGNQFQQWLRPLVWAMLGMVLFQALGTQLSLLGNRLVTRRLTQRFAVEFEQHLLSLPDRFFSQRYSGDIANRVDITSDVAGFITGDLVPLASEILLLIAYLVLTLMYSPILGAVVTSTSIVNAIFLAITFRYQRDASLKLDKDGNRAQSVITSALRDIETIKASAIEHDVFTRFTGFQSRLLSLEQQMSLLMQKISLLPSFLNTSNQVVVLVVGFFLVLQGQLTLGMFAAAQAITAGLKGQIDSLISFVQGFPEFEANIKRLEDVMDYPIDPLLSSTPDPDFPQERTKLSGAIELKGMSFGYIPTEPAVVQELTLRIRPGERIAFVGRSGSGKSSIAKLLAGTLMPTAGSIHFDGFELQNVPRAVAVNSIAVVSQDIELYGCSIEDNLTLWDPSIKPEQIRKACADAQILDVIERLPNGFQTTLKEGGNSLSGGQRQRLDIARALLQDPSILILDEATSALDAESERQVDQALRERGCTQIIVAHRLSTIRDADQIIVMEQGQVIQQGTHTEMAKQTGSPYAELIRTS